MFTLTAQDKHGVAIPGINDIARTVRSGGRGSYDGKHTHDGYRIRKLTPLECFRLQSYPDWWYYKLKEHGISDSQLYKMAGNGVTSAVARDIGERLTLF
ncbi:C-5 cytosine-specific DNA methylase [compost metagenome]